MGRAVAELRGLVRHEAPLLPAALLGQPAHRLGHQAGQVAFDVYRVLPGQPHFAAEAEVVTNEHGCPEHK